MKQLVKVFGVIAPNQKYIVSLYRVETYNHRTTPLVVWQVWIKSSEHTSCVRECTTKREAIEWALIYNQPQKEVA